MSIICRLTSTGGIRRDEDMFLGPAGDLEQLALGGVGDAVVPADRRQLGVVRALQLAGAVVVAALGAEVTQTVPAGLGLIAEREIH